jgi:threonylcarbamoyladenosine tRNA methylthiotransferase MtaB
VSRLIGAVCAAVPELRVRLGSLEPRIVTEEFCRELAKYPNLCPQFHLSMQSGCDSVLQRMNRKYDTARYRLSVELLRKYFDEPAITTDLIVGFPGETQEEFGQTLDFIRTCAFSAMHVFPYSKRPGTPAAKMPDQLPNAVKADRAHAAAEVAARMEAEYLNRFVGRVVPVLFEEEREGLWWGHTPNYIPVSVEGNDLHNRVADVRLTEVENGAARGELV